MEMGLKEGTAEEEKMVIGLKEVEARVIPVGFDRGCPRIPFNF